MLGTRVRRSGTAVRALDERIAIAAELKALDANMTPDEVVDDERLAAPQARMR